MSETAKIRCLVCPRCRKLCKATFQNVQEGGIGFGDVLRAKGVWSLLGAIAGLAVQDDMEPHDAICGRPCGEGKLDGVARHTGLDCVECARKLWKPS